MRRMVALLLVGLGALTATPVRAALVSAPATGASGLNSAAGAATWEARGHLDYYKTAIMPPGYFIYSIPSHTNGLCGNSYCAGGTNAYLRILCQTGAGTAGDGVTVTIRLDGRLYYGTSTFFSAATLAGVGQFTFVAQANNDVFELDWDPNNSTGTNALVQYKVGSWQGSPGTWTSTTSVGLP